MKILQKIQLKPQIFILIFLILLLFTECSESNIKDNNNVAAISEIEKEKEKITAILIEMWDAIEKEDIKRYASFVHPDFTQFGETDSVLRTGKENEVNGIREWIESSSGIHTEMIEPKVTINGNVAWITYYWSDRGTTNGEKFASRGKSTRIFVKENEKWLCIHGHYTLLPNPEL